MRQTVLTRTHPILRWGCDAATLGRLAAEALLNEANLPGKPGLVGPDGCRGHSDMDLELMELSARTLESTFVRMAEAASIRPVGQELRDLLGSIGRDGEARMMEATRGTNTHRGAIWNLGLHVMAVAQESHYRGHDHSTVEDVTNVAGQLASIQDTWVDRNYRPGAVARRRYRVGGAISEAAMGFPHVRAIIREMSAANVSAPWNQETSKLRGLLRSMSSLDDTCLLHRGGLEGLAYVKRESNRLLRVAIDRPADFPRELKLFDLILTQRELSAGGSADLLACALFLTSLEGVNDANN